MNERITNLEQAAKILRTARIQAISEANEAGWAIANRAYDHIQSVIKAILIDAI